MDLNQLPALLAGLGPWGIVIGVGVTLLAQWLRNRVSPSNPSPQPGPLPQPRPGPSETPLLDALLSILKNRFTPKTGGDVSVEAFGQVLRSLEEQKPDAHR